MSFRLSVTALLFLFAGWASGGQALPAGAKADSVVVLKKERSLVLLNHDKVLMTYKVALGGDPVGPKIRQGTIDSRRHLRPGSPKCTEPVLSVHSHLIPQRERRRSRKKARCFTRRRCLYSRPTKGIWLGGKQPSAKRLDRRLHCSNKCGNGRNLASCAGWHANRNQPLAAPNYA